MQLLCIYGSGVEDSCERSRSDDAFGGYITNRGNLTFAKNTLALLSSRVHLVICFCNNSWKAEKQVCSDDLRPRDTHREAEKKGKEREREREREAEKTLKVCAVQPFSHCERR